MDGSMMQTVHQIYDTVHQANLELFQIWKNKMLVSWRWWLEAIFSFVTWGLWILYRKRESTGRLLHAGFTVIILCCWLDFIGVCMGLWYYPVKLVPTVPAYFLFDMCLFPVVIMFFIQFRPKWNPFMKACIFAGIAAFLGEPFFIWLKVYVPLHWKPIYSFPILIVIYLIAHYVSRIKSYRSL